MKTITMTQFREEPGEIIRAVWKHGRVFIITKDGKPVAKLVPIDETITIESDGTIYGDPDVLRGVRDHSNVGTGPRQSVGDAIRHALDKKG